MGNESLFRFRWASDDSIFSSNLPGLTTTVYVTNLERPRG